MHSDIVLCVCVCVVLLSYLDTAPVVRSRSLRLQTGIIQPNQASKDTNPATIKKLIMTADSRNIKPLHTWLLLSDMFYDLYLQPNANIYKCVFIFLKLRPFQMLMLIVVFRG